MNNLDRKLITRKALKGYRVHEYRGDKRVAQKRQDNMYKAYNRFVILEDTEIDNAIYTLQRIEEHS